MPLSLEVVKSFADAQLQCKIWGICSLGEPHTSETALLCVCLHACALMITYLKILNKYLISNWECDKKHKYSSICLHFSRQKRKPPTSINVTKTGLAHLVQWKLTCL